MMIDIILKYRFRSGMSSKSDLRGAIDAKVPVGVVADKLTFAAMAFTLPHYLDQGGAVFIDSGAFSELRSGVEPDWERILGVYETVVKMADDVSRLYAVAPDKVGDQQATLARLTAYRDRVIALITLGCKIIVPLQRGTFSASEMLSSVADILGTRDFVAGIPSNLEALPISECEDLFHPAFHILGRVQMDGDQVDRITALRKGCADAAITADANWLRSRLVLVQSETELVRVRRSAVANDRSFDHPRAAAVSRAILSDFW